MDTQTVAADIGGNDPHYTHNDVRLQGDGAKSSVTIRCDTVAYFPSPGLTLSSTISPSTNLQLMVWTPFLSNCM